MRLLQPLLGMARTILSPVTHPFRPMLAAAPSHLAGTQPAPGSQTDDFQPVRANPIKDILIQGALGLVSIARDPRAQETVLKSPLVPASVKRQVLALWQKSHQESDLSEGADAYRFFEVLLHVYAHDRNPEIRQMAFGIFNNAANEASLEPVTQITLWGKVFTESHNTAVREQAATNIILPFVINSDEEITSVKFLLPQVLEFVNQSNNPYFCVEFFDRILEIAGLGALGIGTGYTILGLLDKKIIEFKDHPTSNALKEMQKAFLKEMQPQAPVPS